MKKLTVFAVLICIAALAFAAGGGQQSQPGGASGDIPREISAPNSPITISVYHETGAHPQPAANNPIVQYLKSKLNVSFTWDILVGDSKQKKGVMIASGQYPDLLELQGDNSLLDAGALIPLEGLIEQYGPRIKALYKDVWDKMKSEDGHTYYLVNYGVFQGLDHTPNFDQAAFWIQKAVLKDAGYPKITTIDQYFDLIAAYYRKTPTINGQPTLPFTILTDDWRAFELWNPPNFLAGNPNDGNGIVNPQTYEYRTFFTMDISKRWFQKLNQLNQQGLIDRSSLTDKYDQYTAKIASGRVLGTSVQGWQIGTANNTARDRVDPWRAMVPLPIVWDANTRPWYRNVTIPNLLRGVGISVSAKDPVRIIRFFNDFLAEDIQRTINWGIEGQHWQWGTDSAGKRIPTRTPAQRTNWNNQQWQEDNRLLLLGDVTPKIQGSFSDGFPSDLTFYYPERVATIRPEDREIYEAYGVAGTNELMDKNPRPNNPWFPTWNMGTPPDGSPAQIALARCENTMKQRLPQMILAAPAQFEAQWTAYVNEMRANGIATYEQFMQDQLNLRLKAWGIRK